MAEQITLAYRLFTMRRWAGASWATAAAWACGLVWGNVRNDGRAEVERAVRQRL
ncbi:hypothetical protein WH367_19265 [Comamonas sp. MYb21]|uniref:hypothetical protein n=1 Tax=Comamonas sp. MYb21 TaxID=1848648 RepID=UPI0030A1144C